MKGKPGGTVTLKNRWEPRMDVNENVGVGTLIYAD